MWTSSTQTASRDLSSVTLRGRPVSRAWHSWLAVPLSAILVSIPSAHSGNGLNGAHPRPFYVFAHNPNTLWQVEADVSAGANALEPDITLGFQNLIQLCSPTDFSLDNLVMWDSSDPYRRGLCTDTKLVDW